MKSDQQIHDETRPILLKESADFVIFEYFGLFQELLITIRGYLHIENK